LHVTRLTRCTVEAPASGAAKREGLVVTLWAKVRAKPEYRQQLLDIVATSALTAVREEPGCLRFNVFQDDTDENVYYFLECYEDEAAFDLHRSRPYYQAWRAANYMRDGASEVVHCHAVIPSDAAYWSKKQD
jgi:(4S)-4-hydroxy-5-phosphonooxypentane-2,3-dione isomerase